MGKGVNKDIKSGIISTKFKLWAVRIIIVIYAIFYFLPYNLKEHFYETKHWGPEFPISTVLIGLYCLVYLYSLIYYAVIREITSENRIVLYRLFMIICIGYVFFALQMAYFIGIYNPIISVPLVLSYTIAFYGAKYYRLILGLYFVPLIVIILNYLYKIL